MAPSCQELEPPGIPARFNGEGGSQVEPLLDQITVPLASLIGDGAYDQAGIYSTVAKRDPEADVIVPPRSTAVPSDTAETGPTQRDRHLQSIAQHGRKGWHGIAGLVEHGAAQQDDGLKVWVKRGKVVGFERGKKPVGPVVSLKISAHD